MNLQTNYFIDGITISVNEESKVDITKRVKITSKAKQSAINVVANIETKFMREAQIARKQDKKKSFFNKHKNS